MFPISYILVECIDKMLALLSEHIFVGCNVPFFASFTLSVRVNTSIKCINDQVVCNYYIRLRGKMEIVVWCHYVVYISFLGFFWYAYKNASSLQCFYQYHISSLISLCMILCSKLFFIRTNVLVFEVLSVSINLAL